MSVTQATAVNVVVAAMLGDEHWSGRVLTHAEVGEALATLAGHANDTLMAGYTAAGVRKRWFAANPCRVCGCTDDRACAGGCTWVEPDLCSACEEVVRG